MHFPLCPWKNSLPGDMTTACRVTGTQDGQMHFYSIVFSPFRALIPSPAAALRSLICWIQHPALAAGTREAPAQVPLAEPQPRLLPAEEGREGPSFLQSPVCTVTSPLRNSAPVIEKGKICTAYSSLQETGGVIQDARMLKSSLFFFFWNCEICALDAVILGPPGTLKLALTPLWCFTIPLHI